jgi:epoxyqueuosine reductase
LSPTEFNKKFKGNPVKRPKRRGYLRNVAVALGNAGQEGSVPALKKALMNEEEALVRGHAAWALGEIGGAEAKKVLEQARVVEKDGEVLEEINSALEN